MTQPEIPNVLDYFHSTSNGAYDLLLLRTAHSKTFAWSFSSADLHSVEKAAWMMRRLQAISVRHARRANLRVASREVMEAVIIITELPSNIQSIWRLCDRRQLLTAEYLQDECLQVLSTGLSKTQVTEKAAATAFAVRRARSRVERSSSLAIECSE